ncbi:carotenoid 1,2-hydratase [Methylobacterium sp. J-088]|uniref:carotenoid 1,2-hydratase n=1 Tax=unclassified Methylobacterium TaxID=2615210 RepID=UPI001FBB6E99|nr:carotenoid 1,2-hydratase [Methylobacterium sp. J-088]MCJ2066674.1 carotenoid 1,2-hydratase [Methylobacterium sp. J-088]
MSDDGRQGLTIIAFIGSVFSPYYAWSAERDPFAHCAMNVVLYGERSRFAMTERRADSLSRDADHIAIGPSAMHWDGTALTVRIDERGSPLPHRLRGTVRLEPPGFTAGPFHLDRAGRHRWWPMAPSSRVEVAFDQPGLRWTGTAYFDTNDGDEALEDAFTRWTWCRADLPDGAAILYDVHHRDGGGQNLSLRFNRDGSRREIRPPTEARLPPTRLWRMNRDTRSDDGRARVLTTYENTPFYARSLLASTLGGEPVRAMHESLSLDRFRNPLVRLMLPFRMPRPPIRSVDPAPRPIGRT